MTRFRTPLADPPSSAPRGPEVSTFETIPETRFLSLSFANLGIQESARILALHAHTESGFRYIVTPNVDHMVRLDREPSLMPLYSSAWFRLNDSRILELLARLSGIALPAAPGSSLVKHLFEKVIDPEDTVLIIGGRADTIRTLRARYALRDIRWHDAPANLRLDAVARASCVDFVRHNPAQWVLIAVGSPQQEMIAAEIAADKSTTGAGICCGASLEFLTGETRRAPDWMQSTGLEWLFRLTSEPGRLWRRYLIDGPGIFTQWLRWRRSIQKS